MRDFGERLRHARRRAKLSQQELAEQIGASRSSVARWERGNDIPSAKTVWHMAERLGVASRYLLGLRDDPSRPVFPTPAEMALLEAYRALSPSAKEALLETVQASLQADSAAHHHAKTKT